MFNKLSLKTKLLFLCGTLLFFTLLVGGVSYWGLNLVDASYHKVANSSLPKIKSIDKMYLSYQQIRINLRTLGMPGLSKEQQEDAIRKTISSIESYELEDAHFEKMPFLTGEKVLYDKLEKNWADFKAIGTKVLGLQKSGLPEDKEKMIAIFLKDCPDAAALYDESIKELVKFHEHNAHEWVSVAMKDSATAKNIQSIIMVVGLLGGLSIGYFFAVTISRLLNDISINLSTGSDLISNITTKISTVSTSLSTNITQQASALQQTTSAVEQTSASVISNADNAKKSSEVSKLSKESVNFGKEAVDEVILSINEISTSTKEIKNQIDKSNEEISEIVKIINEINLKTKVINEIVFQTKLLSFNASVEAARAGEHGKGFAVVAEEVGNLARMSGNSAKEISDLLESSTLKVQSTVETSKLKIEKLMELSNQKIELGNMTAQKCKTALDEIIGNVSNVDALISEITSASHEQSLSIREITKAMGEIDTASYQNSASSKEASVAADSLGAQVEDFRALVTKLNVIVTGDKAA